MRKIKLVLGGIAVLAIVAVAVINVVLSMGSSKLSSLTLANITILASAEKLSGESDDWVEGYKTTTIFNWGQSILLY
jgi:hypothetical protein